MAEPVDWHDDGTPFSPRFGDIYRSRAGGLDQARHVFLHGCGLPDAWRGQPQWRILETGFGLGLNFLTTWQAWRADPLRPRMLHFASIEAFPVSADDLLRGVRAWPELAPLAQALAAQWQGMSAGFHRLSFDEGRVLLTLCVGDVRPMLRELDFTADTVFLDGFAPAQNPAMWDAAVLKGVAARCRRGSRLASWTSVGEVRRTLVSCGFQVTRAEGLPPKRHRLEALFEPAWTLRRPERHAARAGHCVVIGAGLAGACVAASLARRGWTVDVLDAAATPAAGASALPAGLAAPHASPDDNLLSRLTRRGLRITFSQARELLRGDQWQCAGVLEHRVGSGAHAWAHAEPGATEWSRPADGAHRQAAGLPEAAPTLWHALGAWIAPHALVNAWLREPGVSFRGNMRVSEVTRMPASAPAPTDEAARWRVLARVGDGDEGGAAKEVAQADLVVVAAALGSAALAGGLRLQPVRGQVSWAPLDGATPLAPWPVNGNGHFIPSALVDGQAAWLCGSTYGRAETDTAPREQDHAANLARLRELVPQAASSLSREFEQGRVRAWTGVRCASTDRRPLAGCLAPGLWVSTAMGSRGLSFAALCAELIAARLHDEPMPLERRLWRALDVGRQAGEPAQGEDTEG